MPNHATHTTRQQQARLRKEMTEAGLHIDRIAAEMTRQFQLRPRTAYRVACGLTQQQAADRYNGRAVQAGTDALGAATMDASRISNIEAWPASGRRPTLPVLKILARAYSTTMNRLVDFDDLKHMPESDRQALLNPRPAASPDRPAEFRSTPSRRLTQRRILNDVLINQAAEESQALAEIAETANVDNAGTDELLDQVVTLAHSYLSKPLREVHFDLLRVRDRAGALLRGRQLPSQTRDLYLVAGSVCAMLANVGMDYGRTTAAQAQARAAWACAKAAGDPDLLAVIKGIQSSIAYWDGRPAEAARLAAAGLRHPAKGTAGVYLASLEARARGQLGDRPGTQAALEQASRLRERSGMDPIGGVFGFPQAKQHLYAASAQVWLCEPDAAEQEATASLLCYQDPANTHSYGDEAGARLDLVVARLQGGRLDGAVDALRPVLDLPPHLRVASVNVRCARVLHLLRGRFGDAPIGRAAIDEVTAYRESILLPRATGR